MKKFLSLLLSLVLVIGLFPVFTEGGVSQAEAGAKLFEYGALKGNNDGDLMLDKNLKRQDAIVILARLMGKEEEAAAFEGETTFMDIADPYYKPYIAYAEANGWTNGKSVGVFGYNDLATAQQFAAFLLRALGYVEETTGTENYANVMTLAGEKGLLMGVEGMGEDFLRGFSFVMMYNALEQTPKGGDMALKYVLGYEEEPVPAVLTVLSAESTGLKTIAMKFSKAVDKVSVENKVKVMNGSANVGIAKVYLSEDKMAACLVLNTTVDQDTKLKVVADGVTSEDKSDTAEKFEADVMMADVTKPEVTGVEVVNAKSFKVITSEMVTLADSAAYTSFTEVKVDGNNIFAKMNKTSGVLTFTLYTPLTAGEHVVKVSGLKDYAGFVSVDKEYTVTIVEDKTAPVVVGAEMVNTSLIDVYFDEPVEVVGIFKVDGHSATGSLDTNNPKVVHVNINPGYSLGISAIVGVEIAYKNQEDLLGNRVTAEQTYTFKVEDDSALPTVVKTEVKVGSIVEVTFDKAMADVGIFKLKDSEGVETSAYGHSWSSDSRVLVLDFRNVLGGENPTEYTLILNAMKDATVRSNELGKQEIIITSLDEKAPEVCSATPGEYNFASIETDTNGDFKKIKIMFTEKMDEDTLVNPVNYEFEKLVGVTGSVRGDLSGATFKAVEGNTAVEITFDNAKPLNKNKTVTLNGLKDVSGKLIEFNTVVREAGLGNIMVTDAELVFDSGMKRVKVVFSSDIESFDSSVEFEVSDGVQSGLAVLNRLDPKDKNVAYLDFDSSANGLLVGDDAETTKGPIYIMENGDETKIIDKFGRHLNPGAGCNIGDKIVPSYVSVASSLGDASNPDTVTLTFSEDVRATEARIYNADGTLLVSVPNQTPGNNQMGVSVSTDRSGKFIVSGATDGDPNNLNLESGKTYKIVIDSVKDMVPIAHSNSINNFEVEFTVPMP